MLPDDEIAEVLAHAFLNGAWEPEFMAARGASALGEHRSGWVLDLAIAAREWFLSPPHDAPEDLADVLRQRLSPGNPPPPVELPVRRRRRVLAAMGPRPWPDVLRLDSVDDLAAQLELDDGQLSWLADARGLERTVATPKLRNYRYRWLARTGAIPRLIEQPKARLMESQRTVLREMLDAIPAHDAAHGFVRGRSVRTHAAAHVGAGVIVGFDLEDFFASVGPGRVFAIFRTAGYPARVAHVLTALCTNVVPQDEWAALPPPGGTSAAIARHWRFGRRLATPHLPQGAPTSPALANLAAWWLDVRLRAYAATLGATYTRYADDLAFSGGRRLRRGVPALRSAVAAIARDEGFAVQERKSRLMTAAGRQSLCSVVVNERLNVPREEYDRLKAILHDAACHGLDAANREGVADFAAHLAGRIAWVESLNPARGARMRERLAMIA